MTPPDGWPSALVAHLGIELWRIPVVIIAAVVIYLCLLYTSDAADKRIV